MTSILTESRNTARDKKAEIIINATQNCTLPRKEKPVCDDPVALGRVLKQLMHDERGKGISASMLVLVNEDNKGKYGKTAYSLLQPLDSNREVKLIDKLGLISPAKVEIMPGMIRPVERFCKFYLVVEVTRERAAEVLGHEIYRRGNVYMVKKSDGTLEFLTRSKGLRAEDFVDSYGVPMPGTIVYGSEGDVNETVSSGQMKRLQIVMRATNLRDKDGHIVNPAEILDKITYGLTGKLEMPWIARGADEVSKMSTRIGQVWASAVEGPAVHAYAIYGGKFTMNDGYEHRDGWATVNAKLITEMINDYLASNGSDLRFSEDAVIGIGTQMRPFSNKALAVAYPQAYINEFIAHRNLHGTYVVLNVNNISNDDQAEYDKLFSADKDIKKSSKFYGRLIIITDKSDWQFGDRIDLLSDLNSDKATHDLRRLSTANILSFSHAEKSDEDAHMSTQLWPILLGKCMSKGDVEKAKGIVAELMQHEADRQIEKINSSEPRALDISDIFIDEDGNYSFRAERILSETAPGYMRDNDSVLYRSMAQSKLKGLVTMADQFRHPLNGGYYKLGVDPAADFDLRLLSRTDDFVEVLVRDDRDKDAAIEHVHGLLKRYPGPGTRELLNIRVITLDEYAERVDASCLSKLEKYLVIGAAKAQVRWGFVLLPADKGILNLMGGADFDGDGAIAIFALDEMTKKIIDIAYEGGSTEVDLPDDGDDGMFDGADLTVDQKTAARAMANYIAADIPPVGIVVSKHVIFKQLKVMVVNDPKSAWAFYELFIRPAMISAITGNKDEHKGYGHEWDASKAIHKYVSPFGRTGCSKAKKVSVTSSDIEKLVEIAAHYCPTDKSIDEGKPSGVGLAHLADDFDYAARYYAEKSIDAAKKLFPVDCFYLDKLDCHLLGREHGSSKFNVEYVDFDSANGTERTVDDVRKKNSRSYSVTRVIRDGHARAHYTVDATNSFLDVFQEMRVSEAECLIRFVNRTAHMPEMPAEILDYCVTVAHSSKRNRMVLDLVRQITRKLYDSVQNARKYDIKEARRLAANLKGLSWREKQNIADDLTKVVKRPYNSTYKAMADMIRTASRKLSPVERISIMMNAVYSDKGATDFKSGIIKSLLPEEYILWVTAMSRKFHKWDAADRVETRVHVADGSDAKRAISDAIHAHGGEMSSEFMSGTAYVDVGTDALAAVHADSLRVNGLWNLSLDDKGHLSAWRPIEEFIKVPEPSGTVCFATNSFSSVNGSVADVIGNERSQMARRGIFGYEGRDASHVGNGYLGIVSRAFTSSLGIGKHVHIWGDYTVTVDGVPSCRINAFSRKTNLAGNGAAPEWHNVGTDFYVGIEKNGTWHGLNSGTIADIVVTHYNDDGSGNASQPMRNVRAIVVVKDACFEDHRTAARSNTKVFDVNRRIIEEVDARLAACNTRLNNKHAGNAESMSKAETKAAAFFAGL